MRRGGRGAGADARRRAPLRGRRRDRRVRGFEAARDAMPATPIADESRRRRSCSIPPAPPAGPRASSARCRDEPIRRPTSRRSRCSARGSTASTPDTVYLSPAPLYHAAPLRWSMAVQSARRHRRRDGAVRPRGRAGRDRAVPGHHSQWVPTHFVRMLKLPPEVRAPLRRVVAEGRVPRRRALPGAGQGGDDRLVGADHLRVLRRHRGQRLLPHQLARSGWRTRARSARGLTAQLHDLRRGRRATCRRAAEGAGLFRRRRRSSSITTTRPRPPRRATRTAGRRSATSAGWTRRAISTSPTARAS